MTLDRLSDRLVEVFSNAVMTADYNKKGHHSICFGWDGSGLSPLSRAAYVDAFGKEMVAQAEEVARAIVEDRQQRFEQSAYKGYTMLADEHVMNGQPAPVAGQFVWALDSGLKCEGGLPHAISNMEYCVYEREEDEEELKPRLVKVTKVFTLPEEDFDPISESKSAEVLEGIVKQLEEGDYGSCSDDVTDEECSTFADYGKLVEWKQRTFYTLGVAIVCGDRWYIVDTEGYSYSRYILVPLTWDTMFEKVLTAIRERNNERNRQEQERQEREYKDRLEAYRKKCEKWEHLMEPIAPYTKAREEANHVLYEADQKLRGIYGKERRKALEKEQKAFDQAQRKEQNVRKKNILAMVQTAFPGVKFSLKVHHGWGGDWELTWWDGPTEEEFAEKTDLDIFVTYHDCFDGMTDSSYTTKEEHTDFAMKFMGGTAGDIRTSREMSEAKKTELTAELKSICPDIVDDERYDFTDKAEKVAQHFGRYQRELFGNHNYLEYAATIVHRIFCRTSFVGQPETPTVPPTGTDGDEKNNNSSTNNNETTMATKKNNNETKNVANNAQVTNHAIAMQGSEYTVKDNNGKDVKFESVVPAAICEPIEDADFEEIPADAEVKEVKSEKPLPSVTFSTYTTKKGDTAPQIIGFGGEDDPRWKSHKDAGHKYVSASYRRDLNGNKVYILLFGTRYMDVAKALAGAYNTNDVNAWHRAEDACMAIYEQAQRDGKARWEEKKAQWAEKKAEKAAQKAADEQAKKCYTKEDVAAILSDVLDGKDVPEDIKALLAKAA